MIICRLTLQVSYLCTIAMRESGCYGCAHLELVLRAQMKLTSAFGAFLDPVADKLMVSTVLILLAVRLEAWAS